MRRCNIAAVVLVSLLAILQPRAGATPGHATWGQWVWPLDPVPRVVRYFEPPKSPYGPGHRGIDLAGRLGQPVLAVAAGRVAFAGSIAGRGVLVVDHGRLRSTYQPVMAVVPVGTLIAASQLIGLLELVDSHCLPAACLHLGAKRGGRYVDPLSLLGPRPVRLKPLRGLATEQLPWLPRSPPGSLWGGYARGWARW